MSSLLDSLKGLHGSHGLYTALHRIYALLPLSMPVLLAIKAPFGKFGLEKSLLNVNGNISWFIMEIVSPLTFLAALTSEPLSATASHVPTFSFTRLMELSLPTKILAAAFVIHYINRSTISTLRTPTSRAPFHIATPISAVGFNLMNGYLVGSYIGGRTCQTTCTGIAPPSAIHEPVFWTGMTVWLLGFAGNILHDEILYDLRRTKPGEKPKPRYSIPRGGLYSGPLRGISHPNYFCEWIEWAGWGVAACAFAQCPALPIGSLVEKVLMTRSDWWKAPPFLFVFAEVAVMLPRAIQGHAWYKQKFGNQLPNGWKAAIPGIL